MIILTSVLKKNTTIFLLTALIFLLGGLTSQASLRAFLNFTLFNNPEQGPYIETYLAVDGSSVKYTLTDDGMFQSSIEVTMIFHKDGVIHDFDKYELKSKAVQDTTMVNFNFLDQQRYTLEEGEYEMEIIINDLHSEEDEFKAVQAISVDYDDQNICFSGIELVDTVSKTTSPTILSKSGWDLIPNIFDYYPNYKNTLYSYTEIYNTSRFFKEDGKFLIICYIKSFDTDILVDGMISYKRAESQEVYPFLNQFDISMLPSGNYILEVEVRNTNNDIINRTGVFFTRENPDIHFNVAQLGSIDIENTFAGRIQNPDTLAEYIRCLAPRATQLEKSFIYKELQDADIITMQKFFYRFWFTREAHRPGEAWLEYMALVENAQRLYFTQVQKGYETDRGRTYLKYGPPNIVTESYNEPSSYPYEIWQYYRLGANQRNKRFVFWSHDAITNNFTLLHSDAIGEISNYRWEVILNSRWFDPYSLDVEQSPSIWGGKSRDYYLEPR